MIASRTGARLGAVMALTAGVLSVAGCATFNGGTTGTAAPEPAITAVQHALLSDIPRPVGFELVPERSVARESGQFRVAQCEYVGSTHPDAVARFYVEYMPRAQFTLRQKRFDNGQYSLRFESDQEECNVRVRGERSNTVLVLDVGPLPRGSTERDAAHPARRP